MNNIKSGSIKSFGIVFFFVFVIIALYPLLNENSIRVWSLIVSFIFLFLGMLNSPLLKPLNLIWFKFGLFLGKFIAPIVMGIVYFLVVFPTFLLLKIFKRNYLNIKYERNRNSYWLNIKNKSNSMKDQF
jgi:predicted membrane protein